MDTKNIITIIITTITILLVIYLTYPKNNNNNTHNIERVESIYLQEGNDFYIYNYYLKPIIVEVSLNTMPPNNHNNTITKYIKYIPSKGKYGLRQSDVEKYFIRGTIIKVFLAGVPPETKINYIAKGQINIPDDTAIKALHLGMNVGDEDIAIISDPVKSPLGGTSLPRLRIINTTPRTIRLTTGSDITDDIIIPGGKSFMYFGRWGNEGLPLGTIFKDRDGILDDYRVMLPITDLYIGLISDIPLALYNGTKPGFTESGISFDDAPGGVDYPLQIWDVGSHKGSLIDRFYIPKNY